ncbi:MAG: hypothetical protein WDA27_01090 [Actinomycetota bacterium]
MLPRFLDQPQEWLGQHPDQTLARKVLAWIMGPLCSDDESDIESTDTETHDGRLAYSSRVPGTTVEVVWKVAPNGRLQILYIEEL